MRILLLAILSAIGIANAQNTLQFQESDTLPNGKIELASWLQGRWTGTAFGGDTEEIWSPIQAKSMMFVFRHLVDGAVNFYEIGHIKEVENSLIFELRHFDSKLHAWEEKNEVQQFKFIKAVGNRVYFDGFTFENVGPNEMNIYGLIGNDDGTHTEIVFNYTKK